MDTKCLLVQDHKKQLGHVLKHYNKTEENLEEYLEILRKWLKTQKHLPEIPSKYNFFQHKKVYQHINKLFFLLLFTVTENRDKIFQLL